MAITLDFPVNAVPITDVALATGYSTRPGQQATNGMQRSVGISSVQFKLQFTVHVHDEQTARAIRGFLWNMEADISLVRIRMPDRYGIDGPFADATKANRTVYPLGVPFASDVMFSTGVGHAVPTLEATFARDAARNDREVYLTVEQELPGGCAVSIDEFSYGIAGSWTEDDGSNRIKISPALRKAAMAGDIVSLAPAFVGFCVTDNPGYESLHAGMYGDHTLEFVEDLTRLVESTD